MKATITGIAADLSYEQQQRLGREWLLVMHYLGIGVDGVKVEFEILARAENE